MLCLAMVTARRVGECRADAAPLMLRLLGWAGAAPACLCRCHFCAWEGARTGGRCHVRIARGFIAVVPPVMPRSRPGRLVALAVSVYMHFITDPMRDKTIEIYVKSIAL